MLFSNLLSSLRRLLNASQRRERSKLRCRRLEVEWLERREMPAVDAFLPQGTFHDNSQAGTALIDTNVSSSGMTRAPGTRAGALATDLSGAGNRGGESLAAASIEGGHASNVVGTPIYRGGDSMTNVSTYPSETIARPSSLIPTDLSMPNGPPSSFPTDPCMPSGPPC
jgi:hypothetical protein